MASILSRPQCVNASPPGHNGRHFAEDNFRSIFVNKKIRSLIKNSLKIVPRVPTHKNPALVLIMGWCRIGDKPLSEPDTLTYIRDARGRCVMMPFRLCSATFISENKNTFIYFFTICPHLDGAYSWNLSSQKTRMRLYIMFDAVGFVADDLGMQGDMASVTMLLA